LILALGSLILTGCQPADSNNNSSTGNTNDNRPPMTNNAGAMGTNTGTNMPADTGGIH
jgi:hypothetical protein